jgi:hypothetical protein
MAVSGELYRCAMQDVPRHAEHIVAFVQKLYRSVIWRAVKLRVAAASVHLGCWWRGLITPTQLWVFLLGAH